MSVAPPAGADRLARLEERARALALEKSYLELVVRLMARVGTTSGVDDAVRTLLHNVLDVIGGTNILLHYRLDDLFHSVDVYGERTTARELADPLVVEAFERRVPIEREGAFSETRMTTPEFTKSYTWVYPLLAGAEVVGVLEMQHLHMGMRGLHAHLPVFFNYAAQILKNEVSTYARLKAANDGLVAANAALRDEVAVRERAEEELRRAKEGLEHRVAERTRALWETNRSLHTQLAERLRTEDALSRLNAELGAFNRVLGAAATGLPARELVALAGAELCAALGLGHGFALLIEEAAGARADVVAWGAAAQREPDTVAGCLTHACLDRLLDAGPVLAVEVADADERARKLAAVFPSVPARSLLAVPLGLDGVALGCLVAFSTEAWAFSPHDLELAARIGEQVAGALARQRAQADARRLRVAMEQTPESVVITDDRTRILYVNPAFTASTGYDRSEVVGRIPGEFKSGLHDTQFYRQMWSTLLSGATWHGRIVNRRKNGELFTEDVVIVPVRDAPGRAVNYVALKRDVTDDLAREQQVRHAQRLEGVGQLAGGIAHDFNNLLGVIFLQLDELHRDASLPLHVVEGLDHVRGAAERAARLTRQLLSFGRRQAMTLRTHDLNDLVARYVTRLRRLLPPAVSLAFEPAAGALPISGDAALVEQVLSSLCENARDVLPEGGTITLRSGVAEHGDPGPGRPAQARPGPFAWVSVGDTGPGMTDEVRAHLFEPFFTTKDVGRGTGLGLATAYGIVSQHHGWIDVDSALGKGSTFTVHLPLAVEAAVAPAPGPTTRPETRQPTILLVEDEPGIRRLAQKCLEHLGYRVVTAPDGVQALQRWDEEHGHVDLLLTDIVMPMGLSGVELAQRVRHLAPALPVVVMSGYAADVVREGGAIGPDYEFLGKPFTVGQLDAAVRKALAASAPKAPDQG